jgi:beta-lactam-binding protein with PASTA domain
MKINFPFRGKNTLGAILASFATAIGVILLLGVSYFYIYLPSTTNHGERILVPDLSGKSLEEIEKILTPLELRYEIGDSAYSADFPPLTVLQQFPKAGHFVKENRKIYISINRTTPPTLPLPNLFGEGNSVSLLGAEAMLRSNELVRGKIIRQSHPNKDLLIEIRMNGTVILPGTRIPKGSVIDLVVGDGEGASEFVIGDFVGMTYKNAILRLNKLNLSLGDVNIPDDVDTTGIVSFVLRQSPASGETVSIGEAVEFTIGPKGYTLPEDEDQ